MYEWTAQTKTQIVIKKYRSVGMMRHVKIHTDAFFYEGNIVLERKKQSAIRNDTDVKVLLYVTNRIISLVKNKR